MSMVKATIEFPEAQVEINGFVFTLQRSNRDILNDVLALSEKYEGLDVTDPARVRDCWNESAGYVDTVLGAGALEKISGGRPVGMAKLYECLKVIAKSAGLAYSGKIEDEYGDPESGEE